jgi:hypothetical protein
MKYSARMLSLKFVKISVGVIDAAVCPNTGEKNVCTERI